jgi:hypothetical protein
MAFSEENEDVLRRLRSECDDLTQPRDIDFVVVFADELSAQGFADQLDRTELSVSVEKHDVAEGLPWDVTIMKNMVPENEAITDFEEFLADIAIQYGGRNDGWGCFNVVSEKNIQ